MTANATPDAESAPTAVSHTTLSSHLPGLDVLRGLAIAMVLVYHALASLANQPHLLPAQATFFHLFETAAMGVQLFFVLSGFLITGILLDTRHNEIFYRPFYLRRALRILPAYLLMIAILRLTGSISWRFTLASLLFLGNMPSLVHATPDYGVFWSLSVEEQFYLLWPFLVRKLSIRNLVLLSTAVVLGSSFLRFALLNAPPALSDIHFKTWVVADFFAAGALLAILIRSSQLAETMRPIAITATTLGLFLITVTSIAPRSTSPALANLQDAFSPSPWVLFFSGLVLAACLLPGIASSHIAKPLIFLGKISYGLYLVHPWIFQRLERLWPLEQSTSSGWPLFTAMLLRALVESAIAITVSWISRITFEESFLRKNLRQPRNPQDLSPVS